MHRRARWPRSLLLAAAAASGCSASSGAVCAPTVAAARAPIECGGEGPCDAPAGFLRRSGRDIVGADGAPVRLRGVAFGNNVWSNPGLPLTTHHDERDYERIAGWGMNAVRFYLNYGVLEDDAAPCAYKQSGWDYLDRNVEWARRHGVYLILNMHVPPGGFQSNGEGGALWDVPENRVRLNSLWRAIAERYRDEPTVAGYDLLNEPRPTMSRAQWVELASELTQTIREVDQNHLLFVERTNSVGDDWSSDAAQNFFLVPDDNTVYEFHFYEPIEYSHQFADWTPLREGGRYPDESLLWNNNLTWYQWSWAPQPPPALPPGDSDWALYESQPYVIADPQIDAIGIALVSELNAGTARFDSVFVKEYDPSGALVATIFQRDLETLDDWWFWKAGQAGAASVSDDAQAGSASLQITGTDHDANLSTRWRYPVKQGHAYAVGGFMKGSAVSSQTRPDPRGDWTQVSRALIRLDYYAADGELFVRNRAALAASLDRFVAWGEAEGVPLFLGELGLIHHCFEEGRGGTAWVGDMLDLAEERGLHFTYHAYHEPAFGIFQSEAAVELPDPARANQPLIDVLRARLGAP